MDTENKTKEPTAHDQAAQDVEATRLALVSLQSRAYELRDELDRVERQIQETKAAWLAGKMVHDKTAPKDAEPAKK